MPHNVHAKDQLNVRLPPELLGRLKDGAKRHGQTVTDLVTRATETELDRLDGIAVGPAAASPPALATPVFLAAEDEQPQQAGKNCKHRNMRGVKGVCPDCQEWIVRS